MSTHTRAPLNIIGEVLLFAAVACGSGEGPHAGDACSTSADRPTCNGDDEVVECGADGKWAKHVPSPTGVQCSCPDGDDTRPASCVSAGFVGVDRSRPLA
jgi:hypothetical protein